MTDEQPAEAYVSPLRRAVVELLTYDSGWTPEQAAAIAGTEIMPAKAFCSRLYHSEVLACTGAGKYLRGPRAQEWIDKPAKTNPGGRSRRYQAAKSLRDEKASNEWNGSMGREVAKEVGGVHSDHIPLADVTEGEENLTVPQVAKWLNVNRASVRRWIVGGKLPAIRLPGGSYRITKANVLAMLEETNGQK